MSTANSAFIGDAGEQTVRRPAGRADRAGAEPSKPTKEPLYASRVKIHPRKVDGVYRRLKWAVVWVLLGLYYIGPWLRWDRGPGAPNQALLVDLPGRRAYFFFIEIWPQEVYYLTGLLIIGAVGLFLVTAWFGRVWCGFTCPQTVWTDLFMWVERMIEGDRNARIRLDKAPFSVAKVGKRLAKHGAWLLISLATGGAWIMYFVDAPTLVGDFFTGQASATVYGFTFLFTATTYVLAGWAREQLCIYMCPWPRFQSAMFDEDSLVVTYEEWRGEPRGAAKHGQSFEGRGHCVNCGLCWQVCPTGVDIRKGQQMACIGCALCVDACNSVMSRFGLPPELITYDSISNQLARSRGEPTRLRLFRPRALAYIAMLAVVVAVMVFSLATRSRLEVNVLHDRSPLFVRLSDGSLRNGYTVKVLNMKREEKTYTLTTSGIDGATLSVIGYQTESVPMAELPVKPDDIGSFRVFVTAPRKSVEDKSTDMSFVLTDIKTGAVVDHSTPFFGPGD
jgi:cytochrome c oxidase accessory protein FixG